MDLHLGREVDSHLPQPYDHDHENTPHGPGNLLPSPTERISAHEIEIRATIRLASRVCLRPSPDLTTTLQHGSILRFYSTVLFYGSTIDEF